MGEIRLPVSAAAFGFGARADGRIENNNGIFECGPAVRAGRYGQNSMRLKTLELQGFKSFPDKTVISFDRGITVVVGPNGSGKSNISDAMRWVLGEISSKNIRGDKMEDVVFAGSQKRSPMGYAEVSVTFDNTEEQGKILSMADYDEITVTRRYYRVGDSEYFINRKAVRLKDIHELFLNTGLGRDGYSIIGQGKIAEIISQKNDERRAIFEEAAGIAKYRYQKTEATKKLEATNANLVRLEDIAGVLGERVPPLAREAEKAKRYLEIRDAKMAVDIALSLFDIDRAKASADELSAKLILSKTELDDADETRTALERAEEAARAEQTENQMESERLSARILELTGRRHENESRMKLIENDAAHLKELIESADGRIAEIQEAAAAAQAEYAQYSDELARVRGAHEKRLSESDRLSASVAAAEEELAENERQRVGCETRISELRAAQTEAVVGLSVAETQKNSDLERMEELTRSAGKHEEDLSMLEGRIRTAEEKIEDYVKKENEIKARLDTISAAKKERETASQRASEEKNNFFLEISQRRHKIQNLMRMEELLEGYSSAVRFVVSEHKAGRIRLADGTPAKLFGPVSGLITVPEKYSAALEVAFGQSLQNIVCEDEASAKAAISYLKKKNAGRATFYPVSTMRGTELSPSEVPESARGGLVCAASALVSCEEAYRGIIRSLVGRIFIAKDMESAGEIARAIRYRYRIVTLDGQVINAGGSFTGGSLSAEGRMLSRRAQIDRLGEEVKAYEGRMAKAEEVLRALSADAKAAQEEEKSVLSSASVLKTLHDAEQTQLTVLRSNYQAQKDTLSQLCEELAAIRTKTSRAQTDIEGIAKQKTRFTEELARTEQALSALAGERTAAASRLEAAKAEASAVSVELAKEQTHLGMLTQMCAAAQKRASEAESSLAELRRSVRTAEEKIQSGGLEAGELQKASAALETELAACEQKKQTLAGVSLEVEKKLSELRIKSRDVIDRRDLLYRTYTRLESECGSAKDRQEKLVGFLWDEYELTYSDARARLTEPLTEKTRQTAVSAQSKYKNQLKALGSVNVSAIEEYKEVKKQYDELTEQISDLKTSREDLTGIISALEETMRRDFLSTLEEIGANFSQVFTELFGGGRAELRLADPEHVLESGIDINVAPPGKVIKNMSLLSGGEQAFVAIALYFAILKVNPTPFCILDEIEAALDEVNVDKFAEYVKKYSDKTQFVIITHRRGTMEAAERLYGVTMHEKGISDVISIDMSEIEQKTGVKLH